MEREKFVEVFVKAVESEPFFESLREMGVKRNRLTGNFFVMRYSLLANWLDRA